MILNETELFYFSFYASSSIEQTIKNLMFEYRNTQDPYVQYVLKNLLKKIQDEYV